MKETYYFQHDYNARNDPKLQQVLMEYGATGIGVFWCIIEMLYEQDGSMPLSSCKSIAFSLHVESNIVDGLINNFDLFENDGENFWSESVNRRLTKRSSISEKRREAGKLGWQKTFNSTNVRQMSNVLPANAEQTKSICPAIKEKKRIEKETSTKVEAKKDKLSLAHAKELLEVRSKKFYDSLIPFVELYGKEMIRAFYDYWTEPNKSRTKMRFELEKTWDVKRRLNTWASREKIKHTGNENGTEIKQQQQRQRAREIEELNERLMQESGE